MASVSFSNIVKRFDKTEVLHGVDLKVEDHEFLVLVGPSGCGKSTLLRLVAGLEELTDGNIQIGETLVNHLPPKDREIAMVFQDYALYPHMTVRENMSFGLRIRKMDKVEIEKRVQNAADILQIHELLGRKPKQLSGGQRQRVAIGRSIVRNPKVFLFDEPLSNLDAKLREDMRIELAKLHQKLNNTIIYVTHDQVEAMTLGDRIAVLNGGHIQQVGTPAEVYRRPANIFVAGFIGSPTMNFVEGKLEKSGGYVYFKNESLKIMIPEEHIPTAGDIENKSVVLGIRPGNIHSEHSKTKNYSNEITATFEVSELLGHKKNIHLKLGGTKIVAIVNATFEQKPNVQIPIWFDLDYVHLFDKATGGRLK
jgi:multiple sugar transport system ATP-binding protein